MTRNRKEYKKAYYQLHKEEIESKKKAYYQANKEQAKVYYQANKEQAKAKMKEYYQANKEQRNAYSKAYKKADLNSLGLTKNSIRCKSNYILKQMNLHIDGYEIHHCFGYEDPAKFIYCSKSLHLKIHKYLRDNNIDASTDHWMAIRELVNANNEFVYIKA